MTYLDYLNKCYPIRKTTEEKVNFRKYVVDSLSKKGIEAKIERTNDGKNENIVIGDPTKAKAVFTAHYDTPASSLFPNIMMPKNRVIFYAYQFLPIIFLLVASFAFAEFVGNIIFKNNIAYMLAFLSAYYGLFFGGMRIFKNKNNFNDNTSGVAVVLSIIDSLSADELKNVAFILFDNEEKGKKGSKAYFNDHKDQIIDKFLVNFDCVGNGNYLVFIPQKNAIDTEEYKALVSSISEKYSFVIEYLSHK
jgi:hypothetical protein